MLAKTLSNKDKQKILPNHFTWIRFGVKKATKFRPKFTRRNWMEYTIQIELPKAGCPALITIKDARYPGTSKVDYTGHNTLLINPSLHAGKTIWTTLSHSAQSGPSMPLGVGIEHNGSGVVVLDGRQFKIN